MKFQGGGNRRSFRRHQFRARHLEATGKDINECLAVLRAAAGRLAPDAETRVTLRKRRLPFAKLGGDPEQEYFGGRQARRCAARGA
jgi:hypothetical protein